jgi:hypothetical protein
LDDEDAVEGAAGPEGLLQAVKHVSAKMSVIAEFFMTW